MLETERLILKGHTLANAEMFHQWFNDPEIRYFDDDEPEPYEYKPIENIQRLLERRYIPCGPDAGEEQDVVHFAIHTREDGRLVGNCMLALIDRYHRKCMIGISIGDKSQWGKGYGKEVIVALIDYAFTTLQLNRVGASVYAMNTRSLRLFESLGFYREGVIRASVLKQGEYVDEYMYGLLRSEWEAKID